MCYRSRDREGHREGRAKTGRVGMARVSKLETEEQAEFHRHMQCAGIYGF